MTENFFEFYQIPVAFHPDLKAIRKEYLRISREFHPDFTTNDSENEEALAKTSINNQAYKTLTDDDLRIRHVLEINNYGIDHEDKLSPMFLMEMMEWNERIADEAGDLDKKEGLLADFESLQESFKDALTKATTAFDAERDEELLKEIKEICLKQKYLLRLKDSINTFAGL